MGESPAQPKVAEGAAGEGGGDCTQLDVPQQRIFDKTVHEQESVDIIGAGDAHTALSAHHVMPQCALGGTGKTYLTRKIVRALRALGVNVAYITFKGAAAVNAGEGCCTVQGVCGKFRPCLVDLPQCRLGETRIVEQGDRLLLEGQSFRKIVPGVPPIDCSS